jgi:hypothetical protein
LVFCWLKTIPLKKGRFWEKRPRDVDTHGWGRPDEIDPGPRLLRHGFDMAGWARGRARLQMLGVLCAKGVFRRIWEREREVAIGPSLSACMTRDLGGWELGLGIAGDWDAGSLRLGLFSSGARPL